jgi:hypothetical protein
MHHTFSGMFQIYKLPLFIEKALLVPAFHPHRTKTSGGDSVPLFTQTLVASMDCASGMLGQLT